VAIGAKSLGLMSRGQNSGIFVSRLQLWVALATSRPSRSRRDTLRYGRADSVHSLTGQRDSMGGRDMERDLSYKYTAQLDGRNS